MPDLKVFQVDDYNFIIGHDRQSCIDEAVENYGVERDIAEEDAFALNDEQLETRKFLDLEGEGYSPQRNFKQQLQIEAEKGGEFPRLFAVSEG